MCHILRNRGMGVSFGALITAANGLLMALLLSLENPDVSR